MDGKDGTVLWNTTSTRYDFSSDLVVRTTSYNRDVFLFRMQGRRGNGTMNPPAMHGATGAQRVVSFIPYLQFGAKKIYNFFLNLS